MKTIKKMKYAAPQLEVLEIELEQGIAAGSAGAVGPNPSTGDWGDGAGGGGDWDAD